MKFAKFAVVAILATAGLTIAADSLSVGDRVPAFNVRDITGPNKGKTLCYRCQYGNRPVAAVFTRDIDENVIALIKKIDSQVAENKDKKMASFVVVMTNNPDETEAKLAEIAKKESISNIPLTIMEGDAGPNGYGIQKDAVTTVMMWVESKVQVNEAFGKGKLNKSAVETVAGSTSKILN